LLATAERPNHSVGADGLQWANAELPWVMWTTASAGCSPGALLVVSARGFYLGMVALADRIDSLLPAGTAMDSSGGIRMRTNLPARRWA